MSRSIFLRATIVYITGLVTGAVFVSCNVSATILNSISVLNRTCLDNTGVLTLLLVILAVVGLVTELLRLRH